MRTRRGPSIRSARGLRSRDCFRPTASGTVSPERREAVQHQSAATGLTFIDEGARLGLPAVEHGRRGHRHGAVALDRPADDRGDLCEAERDHGRAAQGPAMHSDMLPHATAGNISPAYRKPHTFWQRSAALARGHDLQ